ncbi:MAG: LCP family protein [Anaerolineae bacterium]
MSSSRQARPPRRAPLIWVAAMLVLGVAAVAIFNTTRGATREFDTVAIEQPASPGIAPWSGRERVNILLLGIDEREQQSGPWRTDTMLVLSVEPVSRTVTLLSIPRDVWVTIPGLNREAKINTAHFYGDAEGYPGGGPALAMATVEAVLDLPIQYYVRLNFGGFERVIDLIGGIDVDVPETIDDPLYPDSGYGYEPLYIPAGRQHMDGRLALKYARTRHSALGDFERMGRQQQVIMAVRDKVLQANLLPQLLAQAGPLFQTLGDSIKTNLTSEQLMQLVQLGSAIGSDHIYRLTVAPDMTLALHVDSNPPQDALVLKPAAIRQLRAELLQPDLIAAATQISPLPTLIAAPDGKRQYVVQPGDTLFSLAAQFGVTLEALMAANDLTSPDIYAGQELTVPTP